MLDSYLIASGNTPWSEALRTQLVANGYTCECAENGKQAQATINQKSFSALVLDLELTDHSAIELLKYIRITHKSFSIILYVPNKQRFEELQWDQSMISRLGIIEVIHAGQPVETTVKKIKDHNHPYSWKQKATEMDPSEKQERRIFDSELTSVGIGEVLNTRRALFDLYIKLGPNRYVKMVRQGEPFPEEEIRKHQKNGCEHFYFFTKDRSVYINFMNECIRKMLEHPTNTSIKAVQGMRSVSEKLIEEVYTQGISTAMVEESKAMCRNMLNYLQKDPGLIAKVHELRDRVSSAYEHSFLVSFFSVIICSNIEWITKKTAETISMGSMLQDIGILKLPKDLRDREETSAYAIKGHPYRDHPRHGAEMLQNSHLINEQIRQIVYQHHEYVDGTGYPNSLTGLKIYPLAKLVALSNGYVDVLLSSKATPKNALKLFLNDRDNIVKYDAQFIRALVKGFV